MQLLHQVLQRLKWGDENSGGSSSLYVILVGFAVTGLVIGTFGRSPDINLLSSIFVFTLAGYILTDYIAIYSYVASFDILWIKWGMFALFSVLIVGFFVTVLEFWRGTD